MLEMLFAMQVAGVVIFHINIDPAWRDLVSVFLFLGPVGPKERGQRELAKLDEGFLSAWNIVVICWQLDVAKVARLVKHKEILLEDIVGGLAGCQGVQVE